MDVFSMPGVHSRKEVFDCVVLCVHPHSGYILALPARKKGLLAKEVAVMIIPHWLTVFGVPRTICSDLDPGSVAAGSRPCVPSWQYGMPRVSPISAGAMAELNWLEGSCLRGYARSASPTSDATGLRRCGQL